jgi:hypothetical protein
MKRQDFIDRMDEAICELLEYNQQTCSLVNAFLKNVGDEDDYKPWDIYNDLMRPLNGGQYWMDNYSNDHNLRFMLLLIFKENVLIYKTYKEL